MKFNPSKCKFNSHKENKTFSKLLQNPWCLFRKCRSREVPWSDTKNKKLSWKPHV